uniref:Uncharacterized protein n=1 Tax=Leptobrachium leishanense TaxID=445787 RepID=A0A8C5RAW0_9ANUR
MKLYVSLVCLLFMVVAPAFGIDIGFMYPEETPLENLVLKDAELGCTPVPGLLKQIDAGVGQVYGVNEFDDIYQLIGSSWVQVPGKLIHVTVGPSRVWGANRENDVYKLQDGNWIKVAGSLKQVDAGGPSFLVGVNQYDNIYCLNLDATFSKSSELHFNQLGGSLKYCSCGPYSCWGVNNINDVYHRLNGIPENCKGGEWTKVDGKMVMLEVSTDGAVYAINTVGQIYKSLGRSRPEGDVTYVNNYINKPYLHVSSFLHQPSDKMKLYFCLALMFFEVAAEAATSDSTCQNRCGNVVRSLDLNILHLQQMKTGLTCSLIPGGLKQIDAGAEQVYGVNDNDDIYRLNGNNWVQVPGKLIHVSVGPSGVWGVNRVNDIFKMQGGIWVHVAGGLKQVDAGGKAHLVGVNRNDNIYCLNQDATFSKGSDLPFNQLEGGLTYYSCGLYNCWGVNSINDIFHRENVNSENCKGSGWKQVEGKLVMVEASTDGAVYGINTVGQIYKREGISASNPIGTEWSQVNISGPFKHVSYDDGILWLINKDGYIFKCEDKSSF